MHPTSMSKTAPLNAGMDLLRDEALLYAEKFQAARVSTHVHSFPGRHAELTAARKWEEVIDESIQWILSDADETPSSRGTIAANL